MNFKCTNSSVKEELNQTRTVISEQDYPHIKLMEQMSRVHLGQLHMIMQPSSISMEMTQSTQLS